MDAIEPIVISLLAMTRLEWKTERHRVRVLDYYWRSRPTGGKTYANWMNRRQFIDPMYLERMRMNTQLSITNQWHSDNPGQARRDATQHLMQLNIMPYRYW